jgi:hypothetical protein
MRIGVGTPLRASMQRCAFHFAWFCLPDAASSSTAGVGCTTAMIAAAQAYLGVRHACRMRVLMVGKCWAC